MNTARLINDQFNYEVVETEGRTLVNLFGIIDEDSEFTPLLKFKNSTLIFNFRGVTSVNSCGIRSWVNFLKLLSENPVEFIECPPVIVKQINMVPSFLGKASPISVFVPYVCDNCEFEKNQLVLVKDYKSGVPLPEKMHCEKCNSLEMEINGNVKQYFAFAK